VKAFVPPVCTLLRDVLAAEADAGRSTLTWSDERPARILVCNI